ncbi:unnamed protein product [Schistosoma curassoni]|uniref:ANK_REP_REGION domain-containing protein n=1 Tax=Schistosoma curassoni TaxID=6186 RepID=A0A183K0R3_9TREM|nr:unnamed protein product [Schistosoma curassoni]
MVFLGLFDSDFHNMSGRNALHHGVVGDPETAVVLCCINKKLVMVADSKFQTPVHYALDPTRSACHKFLAALYHDVIQSAKDSTDKLSENDVCLIIFNKFSQ